MINRSIFDSRLYIRQGMDRTIEVNLAFKDRSSNIEHLINQLFLYDTLVIPTHDFGIIPILIDWLGLKRFFEAMETSTFGFVRQENLMGYAGNGNGINSYIIQPGSSRKFTWWQETLFGDMEKSIELQLRNTLTSVGKTDLSTIRHYVLENSKRARWSNEQFMDEIVRESYADIMKNESLSNFVLKNSKTSNEKIDLRWLDGVTPDSMKTGYKYPITEPVELVLRVADINMELMLARKFPNCDIYTSSGAEGIMRGKLLRKGVTPFRMNEFLALLELNKLPNIGAAVSQGRMPISAVWDLRGKRSSIGFRNWLQDFDGTDGRQISEAYVEALSQVNRYDSWPVYAMRLAIISIVGAIDVSSGIVLSVSNKILSDWLKKCPPRMFLDEVYKLPIKENKKISVIEERE